jgi:hypothetical protein
MEQQTFLKNVSYPSAGLKREPRKKPERSGQKA